MKNSAVGDNEIMRERKMKMQISLYSIKAWMFALIVSVGMILGMSSVHAANIVSGTIYNDTTDSIGTPNVPYGDYSVGSGFVVALYSGVTEVASGTTTADGSYSIQAPASGTYTVKVKSAPTTDYQVIAANSQSVILSGSDLTDKNLFVRGNGGSLSGVVSTQDSSVTLAGVRIHLTGTTANGESISAYTTTISDGSYVFHHLPIGNYVVAPDLQNVEDQGYVYLNAAGASGPIPAFSLSVSLTASDKTGQSFYVIEPNTTGITGSVYNDQNEDGQLTNGLDTPLAGVTVNLYYSDGATPVKDIYGANLQILSGADGAYQFANLAPRGYVLKISGFPAGFTVTGSKEGVGSGFDYINLTLTTNANTQNNFFLTLSGTNPSLGSVSGAVFGTNGSAVRTSILETIDGESHYVIANHTTTDRSIGFSNMIVTLQQSDGGGGWIPLSQKPTAGNGDYSFKGLTPGNYKIVLTPNPATTGAYQFANQTGGKLASRGGTPYEIPVTVTAGGNVTQRNFWFTQPTAVTNFWSGLAHWNDNHHGASGGIGAFWFYGTTTYTLYEEDGSPTSYPPVVGPTLDGYKTEIPNIVPGIYKVEATGIPSSLKASDYWAVVTNSSYHIVSLAGNTNPAMTVSGVDARNSGIHGEIFVDGIGGLHTSFITLGYVNNSNPQLPAGALGTGAPTQTRSAAGDFSWRNLPKGQYQILGIRLPSGYEDLVELDAIYDGIQWLTSPTLPVTIDATAGSVTDVKIRYKNKNSNNYIYGQVWEDVNNNQTVDYSTVTHSSNDFPIEGIVLELLDSTGTPTGATVTTDTKGAYKFDGLGIGTYGVRIKDYKGYALYQSQGEQYATFTTATGVYEPTHFLLAGSTNNDPTAGPNGAGAQNSGISGWNFIDLNGNQLPDPADGYTGSAYTRITKIMSDGKAFVSTKRGSGQYQFYNLGPGNYRLTVTTYGAGTNYDVRWDSQPATPVNRIDVTIPAGAATGFTDNNFQYGREEAGISGSIYLDTWSSGQFDTGNMGISPAGATVEWYDLLISNSVPQGTTTVNADGTYAFNSANGNSVRSGSHWIVLKGLPSGYTLVNDRDGAALPNGTGNPLGTVLTGVTAGGSQNQDFLIKRSISVEFSGRIFVDGDYDGLYNSASPDDSVVAGAKVEIRDSGGNVVTAQNTDGSGMFKIYNLPNGTYSVTLDSSSLSSSLKIAGNAAGTTTNSFTVNIQDNQVTEQNFWLNDKTDAGVAGQVVIDLDNDGIAKINADKTGDMSAGAGIRIYLHTAGTSDQFKTVTTNASGTFRFVPVTAGTYDIEIDLSTLPSGYNLYGNSTGQIGTGSVRIQNVTLSGSMEIGKYFLLAGDSNSSPNLGPNAVTNSGIKGKTTITAQGGTALGGVGISLVDLGSGQEIARTLSKADGSYQFLNLKNGNYKVGVLNTPSGYFTLGDIDTTVYPALGELRATVSTNGIINQDIWFGESSAVGIQGTVSYVNAADSSLKSVLAGMEVELYFSTDLTTPFKTATTDGNGLYQFTNIPTLSYVVKIKDQELTNKGYSIVTPASPGTYTVNNLPQAGDTTKHFEVTGLYSFSGKIGKNDSNGITLDSGIKDIPTTLTWAGPDTILGNADDVIFTSVSPTPAGQYAIAAGKTDINGDYGYNSLPAGNYQISYMETDVTSQGFTLIPVADLAGNTAPPRSAAISTANIANINFVYRYTGLISGKVSVDVDRSQSVTGADQTMTTASPLTIRLEESTNSANFKEVNTTDGTFSFTAVDPSKTWKIFVKSGMQTGYTFSFGLGDSNNTTIANAYAIVALTAATPSKTDVVLGYKGSGKIQGKVVMDNVLTDGRVATAADTSLGANIKVTVSSTQSGFTSWTVNTAADGSYEINELAPYAYTISIDRTQAGFPTGLVESFDPDSTQTAPTPPTGNGSAVITVTTPTQVLNQKDFGYKGRGSISGKILIDTEGGGTHTAADAPFGSALTVTATNGSITRTATVNPVTGEYSFGTVPTGIWEIYLASPPAGYSLSYGIGNPGSSVEVSGTRVKVDIDSSIGTRATTPTLNAIEVNIGYRGSAVIKGRLIYDNDDTDGAAYVGGVDTFFAAGHTVTITGGGGFVPRTVTTNASGEYEFTGLTVYGSYKVAVASPAGYMASFDPDSATVVPPAIPVGDGEAILPITTSTEVKSLQDFGFKGTGKIAGKIYIDLNDNGTFEGAVDQPKNGITVTLTHATLPARTAITDLNGDYEVTGVATGEWTATITGGTSGLRLPSFDYDDAYSPSGTPATPLQAVVQLTAANPMEEHADFGFINRGKLEGVVKEDAMATSLYDASAPGIAGVTVHLVENDGTTPKTYADGTPIILTTDENGVFAARNLDCPATGATYSVRVEFGPSTVGPLTMMEPSYDSDIAGAGYGSGVNLAAGVHVVNADLVAPTALRAPIDLHLGYRSAIGDIVIHKVAGKPTAKIGDIVPYTITIENKSDAPALNITIEDLIPAGFKYVEGSTRLDGDKIDDPTGNRPLKFEKMNLGGASGAGSDPVKRKLSYFLVVGSGVTQGEYTNTAIAKDQFNRNASNVSQATVEITSDPLFDDSLIFGKVYIDKNGNGEQDVEEEGLGGIKLITARGEIITTDEHGRYHIPAVDGGRWERGRNFIIKLDVRSLPAGYKVISDNPIVVRTSPGLPSKINFRVIEVDAPETKDK